MKKSAQQTLFLGNGKLKEQRDAITHLLELKAKMQNVTNTKYSLASRWSKRKSHLFLVGMVNDTAALEDSWTVAFQAI